MEREGGVEDGKKNERLIERRGEWRGGKREG